jgi:thiol-disulfide isomerase/thioredoxin
MNMKRPYLALLLGLIFFSIQSFAAGINFIENKTWKEILSMAKKQNKLVFLDAYATWCGPCKYLQKNVFTSIEVGKFYNANFINVKMDMEAGEGIQLSEELGITSYPTLFFINGDGKVVHKTIGAMESADFIALGKAAVNPEKQYYTIKEKAIGGKLSPSAFHDWVHEAEGMDDEDRDDVVNQYLAATTHPLIEKEMISLIMDHASSLTKSQLDQIFANREKLAKMLETTVEKFDGAFLDLVVAHARQKADNGSAIDFASFKKSIEGYYPKQAPLQTQLEKVRYYVESNNVKALDELNLLFQTSTYNTGVVDLSMAVVDATNMIVDTKKGNEFVQKMAAYQVKAEEKELAYYKDLALLVLYFRMEDRVKSKYHADKVLKNPNSPESVIDMVKSLMEE